MNGMVAFFKCMCCLSIMFGISWINPIPDSKECMEEVRAIYKKMDVSKIKNRFVYMNFRMTTHYRASQSNNNKASKVNTTMEYVVSENKMFYKSDDAESFMDELDHFFVIPSRKVVYWSNSLMKAEQEKRVNNYLVLQDSMLSHYRVHTCKTVTDTTLNYNKIIFTKPDEQIRKTTPYDEIIFYINTHTQEVRRVVIKYPAPQQFEKIDIVYNSLKYDFISKEIILTARQQVLNANGNLLDKYNGYKLIDNRAKSKK